MTGEGTLTEIAVRTYLSKPDLQSILSASNRPTTGSKEELSERVLADPKLDLPGVFSKLSPADLAGLLRDLDIPPPPKKKLWQLSPTEAMRGEAGRLKDYVIEIATKQGYAARPLVAKSGTARTIGPESQSPTSSGPPPRPEPIPVSVTVRVQPAPADPSLTTHSFDEVDTFVMQYSFPYIWDTEAHYEAEMLGALRTRFGEGNVSRQVADSGKRYDIVVKGAARIELKLPTSKAELDRMETQVQRYMEQGGLRVVVVIFQQEIRNRQDIFDSRSRLQQRGATVYLK
jgi:hypothetical protein